MTTIDKMLDGLTSPAKLISYSKWQRALATLKWIFTRIGPTLEANKAMAKCKPLTSDYEKYAIFRVTFSFEDIKASACAQHFLSPSDLLEGCHEYLKSTKTAYKLWRYNQEEKDDCHYRYRGDEQCVDYRGNSDCLGGL